MDFCARKMNEFCYICGKFTIPSMRKDFSPLLESLYSMYFGLTLYKNVSWAPNKVCAVCRNALWAWYREKRKKMPFKVPVIWENPGPHHPADCYVCCNNVFGLNRRGRNGFTYCSVPSAILPVPFGPNEDGPKKPSPTVIESLIMPSTSENIQDCDDDVTYQPSELLSEQKQSVPKSTMDKIVRKLHLTQRGAETLARELKKAKVLDKNVKVTGYRFREEPFLPYFRVSDDNKYAFCHDIIGVMTARGIEYDSNQWRLFIDSSKSALKGVLLFHDNSLKPIPIFYAVEMAETYASMKFIFEAINYDGHKWRFCGDLKVIALVTGLQSGYTKHCCFICLWDSRYRGGQYARKQWPQRNDRRVGTQNIANVPLVAIESVLLPPLHIKLGIVKNFVKALNRDGPAFQILKTVFPRVSEAKLKEGNHFCFVIYCPIFELILI